MGAFKEILELVNKETVSLVLVVSLFLYALLRITKGFTESLGKNSEVLAKNTTATTRVADALNQIALRMPNYGCSKYINNSSVNTTQDGEEVKNIGC